MPKPILSPELAAELAPATLLVRGGSERSAYEETSEALFLTSGFVYGSAAEAEAAFKQDGSRYVYSRYRNTTVTMFEERLRLIEGAEACRATASGMAAVFAALLCKLRAGQRLVASRALFGSCHYIVADLLPRYGIETVLVDGRDLSAWETALAPGAAVTFCESPSNPAMEIIDIAEVARLTHRAGVEPVQRLAFIEGAGDPGTPGRAAMPHRRFDRALSRSPPEDRPGDLPWPAEPPAIRAGAPPDDRGRHRRRLRHIGRQGRLLPLSRRAAAGRHLQQPRRFEKPGHASRDDDAFPAQTRGARRARHRRRAGPPVGRTRSGGRPHRRHQARVAAGLGW